MDVTQNIAEEEKKKECAQIKKNGYNYSQILLTGLLLLGPLSMGLCINSLGNEFPIRAHFAKLHGYTTNNSEPNTFPVEIWSLGFLFPFGGLFGALSGGYICDKIGRRKANFLFCSCIIIGAILKIVSRYSHVSLLFISRFFDGVGSAGFMISAVLLLLESLPEKIATIYKPLIQMCINMGILMMGIISLDDVAGDNWNLIHIIAILTALIVAIVTFIHPESPKYIYSNKRDSEATIKIFKKLRGEYYDNNEFIQLKEEVEALSKIKQLSIVQFFKDKRFTLCILSLIFLHIGQQLCGINAIVAFTPSLLKTAGFPDPGAGAAIIFAVAVSGSILFAPIISYQKRKLTWLTGYIFMVISFCGYMINDYAKGPSGLQVFWLCLFVFMFQIGPGPVVWFISLEMFPPQAIAAAQGVGTSFNWFANTLVYLIFPIANNNIGSDIIFFFVAVETFIMIYSVFFILETLNKTPNEVLDEYYKVLHKKVYTDNEKYAA